MEYSISIKELLSRPNINEGIFPEFYNKMSNEEVHQFQNEVIKNAIENGVPNKFPDMNAAIMAAEIDRDILINLFKLSEENINKRGGLQL